MLDVLDDVYGDCSRLRHVRTRDRLSGTSVALDDPAFADPLHEPRRLELADPALDPWAPRGLGSTEKFIEVPSSAAAGGSRPLPTRTGRSWPPTGRLLVDLTAEPSGL